GNPGKHIPGRGKVVKDETRRLRFDRRPNTGALQLSEKPRWIGKRAGTHPRHGRRWSKAARGLLEEDYVGLFGTAPNGSNKPHAGPKHAGNLAGGRRAIDHIHEAERGQYGVKPSSGCRQLLGAALEKLDVAQT